VEGDTGAGLGVAGGAVGEGEGGRRDGTGEFVEELGAGDVAETGCRAFDLRRKKEYQYKLRRREERTTRKGKKGNEP
jgi:hypothetical protein